MALFDFARRAASVVSPSDEARTLSLQDRFTLGLDIIGGSAPAAGKEVTRDSATALTAVYGSWRIIADNVGTLDLGVYQERPSKGLVPVESADRSFPDWLRFEDLHQDGQTAFLTKAVLSFLSDGNLFLATTRDAEGRILKVTVLDPLKVTPERRNGRRVYVVDGRTYTAADIFHVPGLILPGYDRGLSPLAAAKETIALGLAAQEYGAKFFSQGATPGGLIQSDGAVSDVGVRQIKAAWREIHEGSGNAHKVAILTEGAKFTKVTLSPDEAQFLQTRQFTVSDVARVYGVPPHLLADASNSTSWGSGLAEQNLAFGQHALRPWVHRIDEGLTTLLRSDGLRNFRPVVRLDLEGATRGSLKEQVETLGKAVAAGLMSQNEARRRLGLAPVEGGDEVKVRNTPTPTETPDRAPEYEPEEGPSDD